MLRWYSILFVLLVVIILASDGKEDGNSGQESLGLRSQSMDTKSEGDNEKNIVANETSAKVDDVTTTYYNQLDILLPNETKEELEAIAKNDSITPLDKYVAFHDVFAALPYYIKEKLPIPPIYEELPQKIKDKIKEILLRDGTSFYEKQNALDKLYLTLTDEERRLASGWSEMRKAGENLSVQ